MNYATLGSAQAANALRNAGNANPFEPQPQAGRLQFVCERLNCHVEMLHDLCRRAENIANGLLGMGAPETGTTQAQVAEPDGIVAALHGAIGDAERVAARLGIALDRLFAL